MKEIGGYIELYEHIGSFLYEEAIALNCGRNALAYLIETKNIKKIAMPYFMCDSCEAILKAYGVKVRYYHIKENFLPEGIKLEKDEWIYLVNYYGQIDDDIIQIWKEKYGNLIADYAQSYFQMPISRVDTLYTSRKYFGVADGAFLYIDRHLNRELMTDESYERMHFFNGQIRTECGKILCRICSE